MQFKGMNIHTGIYTAVETKKGLISRIENLGTPPAGPNLLFLSRGFVDIQVNGYRGRNYSGDNLDEEGILEIMADLAQAGTLRHLPTVITGSYGRTRNNLITIRKAAESNPAIRAAISGIHLEGPYISGVDGARGAHDSRYVRDPDINELIKWQEAAHGLIRLVTLAPERERAISFIRAAVSMGITTAIGHTLATQDEINRAVDAGASLSTHLGNGYPVLLPRLHNPIWAQLAQDCLDASVIADGFHLPDSVLRVFTKAKGLDKIILTSDAGPMGGLSAGMYELGNIGVEVFTDGHLGLAGTEYLAGAGHLLDRGIAVFRRASGCTLRQAVATVTDNPVRVLKLDSEASEFIIGEPSDIICFREGVDQLDIKKYAQGTSEWDSGWRTP
jgi:N-acetylglucosamine-6-phosphate deacetylase